MDDLHLPKYVSLLTPAQKIGVFYGDHIARPVPRAEAEEIAVRTPAPFSSILHMMLTTIKGFHSRPYLSEL